MMSDATVPDTTTPVEPRDSDSESDSGIDEAEQESFPCSDPPSFWAGPDDVHPRPSAPS
jgi:hypothetical protein